MRRYEDSKTWGGLLPCRSTPSAKRLKSSDNLCSPMNRTSISSANSRFSCTPLSQIRSEEHTSELQSLMRISYAVFCLKKKQQILKTHNYPAPLHTHLLSHKLY